MNKKNCALKLVDEIILYYDARSKKHQNIILCLFSPIRIVTDIRIQDLLNSLPISFKQSKYCLPISTTVNFCIFPLVLIPADCSMLLEILPVSGHELYFLLVVQNCPFQFHLDQLMKLQLQLLSLEHLHSSTLQVVLQKVHDFIIWPFPFHRGPST